MSKHVKLSESDILSHLVLTDEETATEIAGTSLWAEEGKLEMDIKVNGVPISTEIFRKVLEMMWKQATERADADVDASTHRQRVEDEARKIVKDSAEEIMDKMQELNNKLEDLDSMIKYPWED